jgi:hypothetical protein
MANARLIQEALINLLESKKANTTAQKGVSSQLKGGMVDQVDADIADARAADLARKRVEAQRVQGTDPLAQSAIQQSEGMVPGVSGREALGTELSMRAANRSMFEGGPEGGSITDNLRRTQHSGDPARLPGGEAPALPDEVIPPQRIGRGEEADDLFMDLISTGDPQRAGWINKFRRLEILNSNLANKVAQELNLPELITTVGDEIPF